MPRRALPLVVLLCVLAAGAAWSIRAVVSPGTDAATGVDASGAAVGTAGIERPGRAERRRVTPTARADVDAPAPDAATDGARGDSRTGDSRTGDSRTGDSRTDDSAAEDAMSSSIDEMVDETVRILMERINARPLADGAVHATPDRDALTDAPVAVAPAAQPAMALATYVSQGSRSVHYAVELVGERRPVLEDGVPVSLTGRVLSGEDESPVIGAEVVVMSTFYVRSTFYDHHLREVARTTTDHDGRFTIERLNADPAHFGRGGKATLTVSASGFVTARGVPIADLTPTLRNRLDDVRLTRAAHALRGRVVDAWDGQAVAGARVVATGAIDPVVYPKDQREALFVGAPQATTDSDGHFVLEGLATGPQMVSVHGGDDCLGRESVRVPSDAEVTLRTRSIGGRIEGTVLDAFGEPVPLVFVDGGGNSTHSFADGRFVLENIRGESVTLRLSHPEFVRATRAGVADGATGVVVRLEHRLPVITLDVRDADTGAALDTISVHFAIVGGAPQAATSTVRLAADGRHRIVLREGAPAFLLECAGHGLRIIDLSGVRDGDTVRVDLARHPK